MASRTLILAGVGRRLKKLARVRSVPRFRPQRLFTAAEQAVLDFAGYTGRYPELLLDQARHLGFLPEREGL